MNHDIANTNDYCFFDDQNFCQILSLCVTISIALVSCLLLPHSTDTQLIDLHNLWLLVDPVVLGELPGVELLWLEPETNLVLGAVDTVRAVADVATDIL